MRYQLACTIGYVHMASPHSVPGTDNPKYSVVCIIPANDPRVAEISSIIQTKIQEKWGANPPANLLICLKKGEEAFPKDPSMAGMMIISAASKEPVPTADANAVIADPAIFYSGCTALAHLNFYAYDNVNKGVSAGLNGLQFIADGERTDGRPSPEQMFAPIEGAPPAVQSAPVVPADNPAVPAAAPAVPAAAAPVVPAAPAVPAAAAPVVPANPVVPAAANPVVPAAANPVVPAAANPVVPAAAPVVPGTGV